MARSAMKNAGTRVERVSTPEQADAAKANSGPKRMDEPVGRADPREQDRSEPTPIR